MALEHELQKRSCTEQLWEFFTPIHNPTGGCFRLRGKISFRHSALAPLRENTQPHYSLATFTTLLIY